MESKHDLQQPISTLQTIILGRYTDQQLLQALQLLHKILTKYVVIVSINFCLVLSKIPLNRNLRA